jgi:hypothetical protein
VSKTGQLAAADVDAFYKLRSQLEKMSEEIGELSKKKPDGPINKFKLGFINEQLGVANGLLEEAHYRPFKNFVQFDDDALPSNSDVVMVLSQYLACLEIWRKANVYYGNDFHWYWRTAEGENDIPGEPE